MSTALLPPQASILLVDDYPANVLALEAILQPLGHRLVRANSGEEALKAVLRDELALIIMDVQMPGLDGFQTAEMIKTRDRSRHIPIIFLTAISQGRRAHLPGLRARRRRLHDEAVRPAHPAHQGIGVRRAVAARRAPKAARNGAARPRARTARAEVGGALRGAHRGDAADRPRHAPLGRALLLQPRLAALQRLRPGRDLRARLRRAPSRRARAPHSRCGRGLRRAAAGGARGARAPRRRRRSIAGTWCTFCRSSTATACSAAGSRRPPTSTRRERRATRRSAPTAPRTSSSPPCRTSCARRSTPSSAGRACCAPASSTAAQATRALETIERNAAMQARSSRICSTSRASSPASCVLQRRRRRSSARW